MSILVVCPKCQKKTKIERKLRDKKIKCPGCSAVFNFQTDRGEVNNRGR